MVQLLLALTTLSVRMPTAETFKATAWVPQFTANDDLQLTHATVAFATHCSRLFDPLAVTRPAVCRVVATMKAVGFPVVYLHDQYNASNPAWMYLYDDWQPTAYVSSDIGHIDLDLSGIHHVICLGGFFGQCELATVTDAIRLWRSQGEPRDLRVTQIVDGVFTVAQHVQFEDPYSADVRDYIREHLKPRHSNAVVSVDQILERIEDRELQVEFLKRQLPPLPANINVKMDLFTEVVSVREVNDDVPTLTFAYRRSADFLEPGEFSEVPD